MQNIGLVLNVFGKIWGVIKCFFWRSKDIVYVNANVKNANLEEIKYHIKPSGSKYVNCQSQRKAGLRALKWHFLKMRMSLFQIQRNAVDLSKFTYCGFASQMFSVYDGFILGNTMKYNFVDFNGEYYPISSTIKSKIAEWDLKQPLDEVDLVISTSYEIDTRKCKGKAQYVINDKAPDVITDEYLEGIYAQVKGFLDSCGNSNVKRVNLYITAKQSVSFVIGTAIQQFHPVVRVYEYRGNEFKYYLDLSKGKIFEVKE